MPKYDPDAHYGMTPHRRPGYAIASAPMPAPEGTVYVPELGTHVDHDIAAQFGLAAPVTRGAPEVDDDASEPMPLPMSVDDRPAQQWEEPEPEMSDEELEALQDELEQRADQPPAVSEAYTAIAEHFTPQAFSEGVEKMIAGDFDGTLDRITEATGLNRDMASSLVETMVAEASPVALENLPGGRWEAMVYAASRTDDPFARQIVSHFVSGKLHPSKLPKAYDLWYQSLPDAEGA